MQTKRIEIQSPHGLHMRVAAQVVRKSQRFKSKISIHKGDSKAEADSILGLLSLGAPKGTQIHIVAQGEDETKAVQAVSEILMDGAGI